MGKLERAILSSCCVALLAVAGCTDGAQPDKQAAAQLPQTDLNAAADEIRQIEARWISEYASGDVSSLADHYSHDAMLMQAGMPAVHGLDRIAASLADSVKDGAMLSIKTEKVEVARSGDWAYSRGTYTLTAANRGTKLDGRQSGNYLTIYKKQEDGSWKAVEDVAT